MRTDSETFAPGLARGVVRGVQKRSAIGGHKSSTALPFLGTLGALGVGAALMYFFDPGRGKRRRKLLGDKAVHTGHVLSDAAGKTTRDVRNRVTGVISMARHRRLRETVDDRVLVERTRAQLGRMVTHPGAIQVTAQDGRVALAGPVLRDEADRLVRRVRRIRGVKDVEDMLELQDSAEGVTSVHAAG